MIVVHHLNNSRSQRILWLLEELDTPYRVETYRRDAKTNLAPSELRAVHPLGKSPVIQDGDLVLAESGAIIEYLLERHGNGRLVPARGTSEHVRYLHWMHFAEGTIMLHLVARLYLGRIGDAAKTMQARVEGMIGDELDLVEAELTRGGHMAGAEFSAADVQMMFRWNLPHSPGSWTPAMPDCAITSPGCGPGLLTAERWTGVAPTPSMPRARMTQRGSRDQAADASVVRGPSRLHGIDPLKRRCGSRNGWPK
jgi:glutathione S-transferase